MSSNLQNSIWPNAGGTLGQIKVQIPDGINTTWPEGDALVHNFVFNKGKLVGFVDTKALIANESKSTTFPYDYVNITVDGSLEGVMSFNPGERTKYFTVTYTTSPNTDGGSFDYVIVDFRTTDQETIDSLRTAYRVVDKKMYDEDGNVIGTWDTSKLEVSGVIDLENEIVDGVYFNFDPSTFEERGIILTEFDSDLSSLTNGSMMFYNCSNLTTFTSDLSSLTNGSYMFYNCSNLTTFTSDLSSLTNGYNMFSGCCSLNNFTSDLSSFTNGSMMFYNCENLTTFTSDLSSLTNGSYMFHGCSLDVPSVQNIAQSINTVTDSPILHLGIGRSTATPEDEAAFQTIREKGWSLHVGYNPSTTSEASAVATLDETDETQTIPTVYWAKPVPSDEKHAHYIDSEGNYYNILGGNLIYVNDPDTYGMFINEEDAAANMRLTKIEK